MSFHLRWKTETALIKYLYTMVTIFIFCLLISCGLCTDNIGMECIEDHDCLTLKNEILDHINNSTDPCRDVHSYMCAGNERFLNRKSLQEKFSEMKNYFNDLLSSRLSDEESELLLAEKKLYQLCMQLDNSELQHERYYSDIILELNHLKSLENWEHIENKLFSLGFGFSFFDIKVIPHPEYESRNTILLQPKSLKYLNSLINRLQNVEEFLNQYQQNSIGKLYDFLDRSGSGKKVLHFFETLKQAKIGLLAQSTSFPGLYITVGQLKEKHIQSYYSDEPIKVNWIKLIQHALHKENIEFDTDNVVLKNPQYFLHMSKLLDETPSDIIALAIKTKLVTDVLPYTDWETANLLQYIEKTEFCLKETKLYGASRQMVHDWIMPRETLYEDDNRHVNFKKGEAIFERIMSTIQEEISLYNSHPSKKASYYLRKLFHVIDNLSKYVYEPPYNIYEGLDFSSHSYFKTILEYRKLLASNDLQLLKNTFDITRPVSFIDQDEPQNRFILGTLLNIIEMHSPNLPRQMHYGTFGIRTAALIHSLLHEDTYNDDHDVQMAITKSLTYPKYSRNVELCISSRLEMGNSVGQIDETITQVLALNTVYKALKEDRHTAFHSISNTLLSREHISSEKLFFLAYVQDNCGVGQETIDGILVHNQLFDQSFKCNNTVRADEKTCMLGKLNY